VISDFMGEDGVYDLILVAEYRHLDEDRLDAAIDQESPGDVQRLSQRKLPYPEIWRVDIEGEKPFSAFRVAVRVSGAILAGSSSISVQTLALQRHHPCAKQVNAGTAIHAPLERLQPVDLSLRLTIAPGFQHGIANGLDVLP